MIGGEPEPPSSPGSAGCLYDAFIADVVPLGVERVKAVTWPGNRVSVGFHTAIGFRVDDGPGTQRLYGTPAYPDYDGQNEDRVVFVREVGPDATLVSTIAERPGQPAASSAAIPDGVTCSRAAGGSGPAGRPAGPTPASAEELARPRCRRRRRSATADAR